MICLKNLHEHSEQEVFDQLARHLLTQGKKAVREYDIHDDDDNELSEVRHFPAYLSNNNGECLRSPAGSLMALGEYRLEFENKPWFQLAAEDKVPRSHSWLVNDLDTIHDLYRPEDWRECLFQYATHHGLSPRVLEEFPE